MLMKNIIFIVLCLWNFNSSGQQYVWDNAIFAESHNNTMPVYRMELTQADEKMVLGYYRDSLNIANQSLFSTKNYGIFLAKYNAHNDLLWVKTIAERKFSGNSSPIIEVDNDGNIFTSLIYTDTLFVNNVAHIANDSVPEYPAFSVLKFNPEGELLDHVTLSGTCFKTIGTDGMKVDELGNLYILGSFGNDVWETTTSCNCIFGVDTLIINDSRAFIAKYNSIGELQWFNIFDAYINNIDVINNNVYIAGTAHYASSVYFNSIELDFPSFYDYAGYIAKFDTSGVFHWAKHFGVQAWDSHLQILDLHIVSDNNIILAGKSYTQSVPNQVFFQNAATLN